MPGTKILSAFLIMVPATVLLTAVPSSGEPAADQCKPTPNGAAPRGSHWYYHINRATKQHCWYLGQGGAHVKSHTKLAGVAELPPAASPADQADADDGAAAQSTVAPPTTAQSMTADAATPASVRADAPQPASQQLPLTQTPRAQNPQAAGSTALAAATGGYQAGTPEFGARWPENLPKADDALPGDPAPVSNSYAERHDVDPKHDLDATGQLPSKWPVAAGGTVAASAGEKALRYFSIAGIVAIPLLLLLGWVAKYARGLRGVSKQSIAERMRPRRRLSFEDAVFAEPAANGPVISSRGGSDGRAQAPTDPKQDLKTSLAELMRDLRRAAEPSQQTSRVAERSDARSRDTFLHLHDDRDDDEGALTSPYLQAAE
jgi:hypothetical protein